MNRELKNLILDKLNPISYTEICDAEFQCIYDDCVRIFDIYEHDINCEKFTEFLEAKVGRAYGRMLNAYHPPGLNLPSGVELFRTYDNEAELIIHDIANEYLKRVTYSRI